MAQPTPEPNDWTPEEWVVPGAPVKGYVWRVGGGENQNVQASDLGRAQPRGLVLLSHGVGEYARRYVRHYHGLIPALVQQGFSVYAYDQRGHGASEGKRALVDLRELVEDHLKAREALRSEPQPLFLFGHSMGGLVTASSVLRDSRGVSGVILSSPGLQIGADESAAKKRLAPLLARVAPGTAVAELPTSGLSRLRDEVRAYETDPQIYHGKVLARTAGTMLTLSDDLWRQYPRWKIPTLIFHGTDDRITDPRGSRRFVETITATDKTLLEFRGGYHELLNDEPRAEVRQLILDWLRERS